MLDSSLTPINFSKYEQKNYVYESERVNGNKRAARVCTILHRSEIHLKTQNKRKQNTQFLSRINWTQLPRTPIIRQMRLKRNIIFNTFFSCSSNNHQWFFFSKTMFGLWIVVCVHFWAPWFWYIGIVYCLRCYVHKHALFRYKHKRRNFGFISTTTH